MVIRGQPVLGQLLKNVWPEICDQRFRLFQNWQLWIIADSRQCNATAIHLLSKPWPREVGQQFFQRRLGLR